ncbi:MAG: fumarylacetoacetate hydrolase family protein, partial [Gammaproteobacteria bacterium]|nr:fumarylacetoacetate hydrolase family protein [Gammaproteobacteria bacterium]
VAIGKGGESIEQANALEHVWGYGVGIDMTRRDLQAVAKSNGQPWEASKAFDDAAPLGALCSAEQVGHPARGRIWLTVNGDLRQDGDLGQLIWSVPEVIQQLSSLFRLEPGDLIYTGTPAGVGPVVAGDVLEGGVDGLGTIRVQIV